MTDAKTGDVARSQDFSSLRAVLLNCTLKRTGTLSHTEGLLAVCVGILTANDVRVDVVRPVDLEVAPGVQPDMTKSGLDRDDWPELSEMICDANILILATPIWLGEESSVCRRVIERLYSESGKLNDKGQSIFYGRAGGAIVTGNEDGIKHCAMSLLYAMQHVGYAIPPQADAGWVGGAGPGASYCDDNSGGPGNDFTQRNTTFMTWNLMHLAKMLQDAAGIPAHGNVRPTWDEGCRFDHPNPEYR